MSLSALFRKRETVGVATATVAIPAILPVVRSATVAKIARIAVANPQDAKHATSWAWLLHYPDREPVELFTSPESTLAEVLRDFPEAIAAEPIPPAPTKPTAPLTAREESLIRAWLVLIEETDPATIADVLGRCRTDPEAKDYYTGRAAAQLPRADPFRDDRRTCGECANLAGRHCKAAKRGDIVVTRDYAPIRDLPRRCEGFAPGADRYGP